MTAERDAGVLTTAQAADYLGVKVQTLYAYVSRGVLAPVRREPGVGSLFAVDEVRALAGRPGRSGRRGGRSTGPATSDDVRTAITEVGPGSLAYRGHDVRDLAGSWTFEQVRDLLTGITLPGADAALHAPDARSAPTDRARGVDRPHGLHAPDARSASRDATAPAEPPAPDPVEPLRQLVAALPPATPALDRLKHAVLLAGATDVGRRDRRPEAFALAGSRAATAMACSVTGAEPGPTLAATFAAYLDVPAELVDTALVLLADHDLAVSTTAVRVAVSAGSDPSSALLAGLAAADSPLHVGASVRAVDWLRPALLDPRRALDTALADGPPPGFGHVVYTDQDPRAQVLLDRLLPDCAPPVREALLLLERELLERRGWVLTVDVALALLVLEHDLPRDAGSVIFACARTAGWTAHAIEELAEPGMRFRLRGVYTGARHP